MADTETDYLLVRMNPYLPPSMAQLRFQNVSTPWLLIMCLCL